MTACYVVSWQRKGRPYAIDSDDEAFAGRLAVGLAESGRMEVQMTVIEREQDRAVHDRILSRLQARIRADAAEEARAWALTQALG